LMRRRDWLMPLACFSTIILFYIPFLILGHGQVLGFLSHYVGELGGNAGLFQALMDREILQLFGHNSQLLQIAIRLELLIDAIVVGSVALIVWLLWRRERITMEVAILLLIGIVFACSSHIFPWYTPVLLPWIIPAVGWGSEVGAGLVPALSGQAPGPHHSSSSPLAPTRGSLEAATKAIAFVSLWYFPCISVISYFWAASTNWDNYYVIAYETMIGGLGVVALLGLYSKHFSVKIGSHVRGKTVKAIARESEQDEECSKVSQSYLDEPVK